MRALAAQRQQNNGHASVRRSAVRGPARVASQPANRHDEETARRREAACACGGGCPRCASQGAPTAGQAEGAAARSELVAPPGQGQDGADAGRQAPAGKQAGETADAGKKDGATSTDPAATPSAAPSAAKAKCPPVPAPGFKAVVSPRDTFSGRSTSRAGIGETFDLSFQSVVSKDPNFFGGLRWVKESGGGTLSAHPTNGTATWTAPESADSVQLSIRAGTAQQCVMYVVDIKVVEPSGVQMVKIWGNYKDAPGKWGCGALLRPRILPADVSFTAIQVKEGDAEIVGTGWLSYATGMHHCKGFGKDFYSGRNDCALQSVKIDPSLGTIVAGCDRASTGGNTGRDEPPYGTDKPFADGSYTWDIPFEYKIGVATPKQFATARVTVTSDAAGNATMTKAGSQTVTCGLNDARSDWDYSKCK